MKLTCPQKNDAFTVNDTSNGNGALTYPVGLLSTDEIVLAGGWDGSNNSYYLYSGQYWWASSPHGGNDTLVRGVNSNSKADHDIFVGYAEGVRPVLNLKAEVLKYGDGTINNPYKL